MWEKQIELVLKEFGSIRASEATIGNMTKIVGRAVLAGNKPFYSPVNNIPCVYFRVMIEQERLERSMEFIEENGVPRRRERTQHYWETVVKSKLISKILEEMRLILIWPQIFMFRITKRKYL